jgi:hypothetical protein
MVVALPVLIATQYSLPAVKATGVIARVFLEFAVSAVIVPVATKGAPEIPPFAVKS